MADTGDPGICDNGWNAEEVARKDVIFENKMISRSAYRERLGSEE